MLRVPSADEFGRQNVAALYQDALELAVAADQLGFDSLWITQHHFGSVDSSLPSPLVFLAAVAARTKTIRLGTTVITAALEHPIRLAEDAATLDVVSGGRVELGLGTSGSDVERAAFGVTADTQRERLHRTTLEIAEAFEGRPINGVERAILQPRTPDLAHRIWLATTKRPHAAFAARNGFGLITNYRPSELPGDQRTYLDEYVERSRRCGFMPRVGMSRGIFPARDEAEARRLLAGHATRFADRGRRDGWLPASFDDDSYFTREDFHFGHPDDIVERLQADPGLPYTTDLLTGMLSARLTPRQLLPVVERIAMDVAPSLGWTRRASSAA